MRSSRETSSFRTPDANFSPDVCVEDKHNMLTRSERGIWSGSGGEGSEVRARHTAVSAQINLSRLRHWKSWTKVQVWLDRNTTSTVAASAPPPSPPPPSPAERLCFHGVESGGSRSPARLHACRCCLKTFNCCLFAGAGEEKEGEEKEKHTSIVDQPRWRRRQEESTTAAAGFDLLREPFSLNLPLNVLTSFSV